ncbi:MAG: 8-amino-7-oxononanoate synthase [Rikenellaceae bacterium]|jgi:8-amino-7-oxononanoate synthase|nr:8-amino-7-oxononanoate synthase [Rikenellaceae bacterium]
MSWPQEILDGILREDNYRTLTTVESRGASLSHEGHAYRNFSSNDYLGLSSELSLQREFFEQLETDAFLMSNPSSRLVTGNSPHYDRLENTVAQMFGRHALVLGSGYAANSGALPALTAKGDLILADKYVHASIIDGLRLCDAEWKRFNHNDMAHLERLLFAAGGSQQAGDSRQQAGGSHQTGGSRQAANGSRLTAHSSRLTANGGGRVWVVTESLFSMDGDLAPLGELDALRRRYGFRLYVDEAHAFGVRGDGLGYCRECGVEPDVMVATLGKAMASCGAFVVCDAPVKELLVNRMRTLIFSTALPPLSLAWSDFLLRRMSSFDMRRSHLQRLAALLTDRGENCRREATQIVPLMCYDNARALEAARLLRDNGFWAGAIRYPTVPRGKARIRVSLNAALSEDDVLKFKDIWKSIE